MKCGMSLRSVRKIDEPPCERPDCPRCCGALEKPPGRPALCSCCGLVVTLHNRVHGQLSEVACAALRRWSGAPRGSGWWWRDPAAQLVDAHAENKRLMLECDNLSYGLRQVRRVIAQGAPEGKPGWDVLEVEREMERLPAGSGSEAMQVLGLMLRLRQAEAIARLANKVADLATPVTDKAIAERDAALSRVRELEDKVDRLLDEVDDLEDEVAEARKGDK